MQTQSRNAAEDSVSYAPGYEGLDLKSSVGSKFISSMASINNMSSDSELPRNESKIPPFGCAFRKRVLKYSSVLENQPFVMSQRPLQMVGDDKPIGFRFLVRFPSSMQLHQKQPVKGATKLLRGRL